MQPEQGKYILCINVNVLPNKVYIYLFQTKVEKAMDQTCSVDTSGLLEAVPS